MQRSFLPRPTGQASSAGVGNGDLQHLIEDKRYYKPNTPFEAVIREGGASAEP